MHSVANIIVDVAVDKVFDYSIPDALKEKVLIGSRVSVPFGKSSTRGYVIGISDKTQLLNLKSIYDVVGDGPLLTSDLLKLSEWMAEYYLASKEICIRTVLPGAIRKKGAAHKRITMIRLAPGFLSDKNAYALERFTPKQQSLIDILKTETKISLSNLNDKYKVSSAVVNGLRKRNVVECCREVDERNPLIKHNIIATNPLDLMPEQAVALECITEFIRRPADDIRLKTALLYGVTGSGKTEVYLQAIEVVLKLQKGAIVLVPEISLTPQTIERFVGRFGERIAVLHSHLSDGERHDEWHRIRRGDADIVIGARSAVFAPLKNLGIIIVDEEHEPTYKQDETPRYNARDVAVMRGMISNCTVVLGSATPSLESWKNANDKKYTLLRLPKRADNKKLPTIQIVDMRLQSGNERGSILSRELIEAIDKRIRSGEQVMLFLNRRGYSTSLVCHNCGYIMKCDQCSVCLTYHKHDEAMRCHICGETRKVPDKCPSCKDPSFKYSGTGTQKIEAIISKLFPYAKVGRMDADMTRRKDSHHNILGDFKAGKTDILIGTQMIAKGLHFPRVTLVGVVNADLSLHMPDFRAGERTFQLLAQVAGRAGRGDISGHVIIQTYTPFHASIQSVRRLDYDGYCDLELEFRKELNYPPFTRLTCITFKSRSQNRAEYFCKSFHRELVRTGSDKIIISDPVPAPLERAKNEYRYQVVVRNSSAKRIAGMIRASLIVNKMPKDVSCTVDVDAIDIM